ncbi:hypothetical protein [Paenibacillus sp. GP183]|jgi:hypothetical protein|uniref:hypothetical protein n=1 Tax=Paenibacillus sp. GP183 TaxID=1882751 RepID=UPI000897AA41|nr:hypothetical protein [Paenibacillus sp. GP183]SEC34333.1 hypothetical protein SAMN05443246_3779 [Paenibacillus sp. GP183]
MIDRYIQVIQRTMSLTSSSLECIQYMVYQLEAGNLQQTIQHLHDLVNAFSHMERSLLLYLVELPPNEIESLTDDLRDAIDSLVAAYEKQDAGKAFHCIQELLLPAYLSWKHELERSMLRYTLS